MTIIIPQNTDSLSEPPHAFLHRVVTVDSNSPESSVNVGASGEVSVKGAFTTPYVQKTSNYTIDAGDSIIDCTANTFDVTLPTAAEIAGREYTIINSGTGIITVKCDGIETIAGEATRIIAVTYNALTVVSNGTNWNISKGYIEPYIAHGTYGNSLTITQAQASVFYPVSFNQVFDEMGIIHDVSAHNVTISNATPGIISWTGHGLHVDSVVIFGAGGGTLPGQLVAGTKYYVSATGFGVNSFSVCTYPGNTAITTSGGSGTVTALNRSIFKVNSPGDYEFIFSALCDTTSGNGTTIDIWFRKNGSDIADSNTRAQIATATNVIISVAPFIVDLNSGDDIELFWYGSTTNVQLLAIGTQSTPTRPATPSVILTVKKISR